MMTTTIPTAIGGGEDVIGTTGGLGLVVIITITGHLTHDVAITIIVAMPIGITAAAAGVISSATKIATTTTAIATEMVAGGEGAATGTITDMDMALVTTTIIATAAGGDRDNDDDNEEYDGEADDEAEEDDDDEDRPRRRGRRRPRGGDDDDAALPHGPPPVVALMHGNAEEMIERVFERLDVDGDGAITKEELATAREEFGQRLAELPFPTPRPPLGDRPGPGFRPPFAE